MGELKEEVSHPLHRSKDGTIEQAHGRTTTENENVNMKVCVCFLSPHNILFLFV